MSQVVLKVPFPNHLVNYIYQELRDDNASVRINSRSDIGVFLMGVVEASEKPMPTPKEGEYIELYIPSRDRWGKSYDGQTKWLIISEVNIKRLHRMVETIMMRDLYGRLDYLQENGLAQRKGGKMTEEIEEFIAKYSNDRAVLSIENIRKKYFRYRKKRESRVRTAS